MYTSVSALGAMNKRNDPERLEDTSHCQACMMVSRVGTKWTSRLHLANAMGQNSWYREVGRVKEECVLLRHKLSSLPVPFMLEFIVTFAFGEFAEIIASHENNIDDSLITMLYDRQSYEDICANILKSVLLPCMSTCNVGITDCDFVQELLIKLLYVIPNIKALFLPAVQSPSYLQLLMERIQILTYLQEFGFHDGCNTEILIEISKYCPHMKIISVQHSRGVDDFCVQHLLKFRQLVSLNIADTSVSDNSYGTLLLGLTQVQDITWFDPVDLVLGNQIECLPLVRKFVGTVSAAGLLVRKCPNVMQLELLSPTEDISDLGELRHVALLSISQCCYTGVTAAVVIRNLGQTLKNLNMHEVININIDDVFNYCTVLKYLNIHSCHITARRTSDPKLPHFQNLNELSLENNFGSFDFTSLLHYYVNLKVLHAVSVWQITNIVIKGIVTAGGFRLLTEFLVENCEKLTIDTAWLLIQKCPNLTTLGNISSWPAVNSHEIEFLLNFLSNNNFALTLDL
jgi:ribosomal protein L33